MPFAPFAPRSRCSPPSSAERGAVGRELESDLAAHRRQHRRGRRRRSHRRAHDGHRRCGERGSAPRTGGRSGTGSSAEQPITWCERWSRRSRSRPWSSRARLSRSRRIRLISVGEQGPIRRHDTPLVGRNRELHPGRGIRSGQRGRPATCSRCSARPASASRGSSTSSWAGCASGHGCFAPDAFRTARASLSGRSSSWPRPRRASS